MRKITMRKKALSPLILLLLALSLISGLSVNMTRVSAAESPAIYIEEPVVKDIEPPGTFTISIKTNYTGNDIAGWQFTLSYNPFVLRGVKVTPGDLILEGWVEDRAPWDHDWLEYPEYANTAEGKFSLGGFNDEAGELSLTTGYFAIDYLPMPVVSGTGTLANVTFEVLDWGDSCITLGPETKLIGYTGPIGLDFDICGNELYGAWGTDYEIVSDVTGLMVHGYFKNTDVTHDVAVTNVTASSDPVVKGELVNIDVVVENHGNAFDPRALVTERFEVTTFYDIYNPIETQTVSLNASDSKTLPFGWNTTYASVASHIISAKASTVPGEKPEDQEDNTFPIELCPTVKVVTGLVAVIDAPSRWNVHEDILFDASGSSPINDIVLYSWDFGDEILNDTTGEVLIINTTDPIIYHRYAQPGVYGVWLEVTTATGEVSDPAYHSIEIIYPYLASLVKWQVKPEAHHWVYMNRTGSDTWTGDGTQKTFNTTIKPIVEDSEMVYEQFTDAWPADSAFTTDVAPIVEYSEAVSVNFTDQFTGDGETTDWKLTHSQLEWYVETVYVDGQRMYRDADYYMSYSRGKVFFYVAPGDGALIEVSYPYSMYEGTDYTIDYTTGEIGFIEPLPSEAQTVQATYMGNVTGRGDIYGINYATGEITFTTAPEEDAIVEAEYEYDVIAITALARNWGSYPMDVKVTFEFYDRDGEKVGPTITEELTLEVPYEDVEIIVCVDPFDLDFDETSKVTRYIHVTLEYYDPTTEDWIPTAPKIVGINIVP